MTAVADDQQQRGPIAPDAIASLLEQAAEQTNDPRLLRAARALSQQPSGRPAKNDRRAIREARALFEAGTARSLNAALLQVARSMFCHENPRSVAERLRRKISAEKKSSTK